MPTAADVAVVRRFFAALAAGDLDAAGECLHEEAIWHFPGASRIAGTHRGWPAIRDNFLAKLGPLSRHTFRAEVLDVAVGAEYIVEFGTGTAEHAGRRLDVTVCQLMRIRGGKILEVRGHYSDQAALDAFWGPNPLGSPK